MADHSLNTLRAAARAMHEVVLPAVDRAHPLAAEQAGLVARLLDLFAERIDLLGDRARFELQHHLALADAVQADAAALSPAIGQALAHAATQGRACLREPAARPSQQQAAAQALAGVLSALVRTAGGAAPPLRARIEGQVLQAAQALLQMQRAWFAPQGWEPDPAAVPPLAQLLRPPG
jgi:hypothetical protein